MTFTVTPLVSGGHLVEGTDSKGVSGTTVLHSPSWDYCLHLRAHEVADADFEATVEAFFKPLTDAADAHIAALTPASSKFASVTFGTDVEGKQARTIELDPEGIVLNMLDAGKTKKLRWVNGSLVAVL
jgi:hypothetical protein